MHFRPIHPVKVALSVYHIALKHSLKHLTVSQLQPSPPTLVVKVKFT